MRVFVLIALVSVAGACRNDTDGAGPVAGGDSAAGEIFDQRITVHQVLARLRDADVGRVSRAIIQLGSMPEREELDRLLTAVWQRDLESFSDLNWNALESPSARIAVARVLGRWHPNEEQYHQYLLEMSEHAEVGDRVDALMGLGSLARDADLERLKMIAVDRDELLATGAMAGLIASNKESAIQALERIAANPELPDQRRRLAGQLLSIPRPPQP